MHNSTLAQPDAGAATMLSEWQVIGAAIQSPNTVLPLLDGAGVSEKTFEDVRCRKAWRTLQAMREARAPIELVSVAEKYADGGDSFAAMQELEPMVEACTSPEFASYHAEQIRLAEKRRDLLRAAMTAQEQIARGGALDVIAAQLRAAGEAAEGGGAGIGGPLATTFPPIRYSALRDLEVKPEDHHVVGRGWLRRGAWTLFTGGTGIGKSVLVEQMAACVACGKSVFGLNVARPFKVLMLTAEQDDETLKRDLQAIAAHENLDPVLLDQHLQIHHAYALDGSELVTALDSELRRGRFDLLLLDNYQSFSGATDLNDSAAWKAFITPLVRLLKDHRAAMLLVDHTGKPQDRKGWGRHDSVYLAAGTSRKANGARCSAELYSPAEGDERYRLHLGKNWERAGVVDDNGHPVRDIYLDRAPDAHRPYWTPSQDQTDHKPMVEGEQEIVEYATAHPFEGVRKVAEATGHSKSKVQRILAKHPLLSHGREEKP